MVSDFELDLGAEDWECSGERDDVEKVGRDKGRKGRSRSWQRGGTGGGHVKFLHPAGVDVGTYASRKRASELLDHSVNYCAFSTTKTVLGYRDTGLPILLLNANFTVSYPKTVGLLLQKRKFG
jgi:hypothetical protein